VLKFRRLCYGPEQRRPGLLWVECEESSELVELRDELLMAFEIENDHQFRPHVTLARLRAFSASLARKQPIEHDLALAQQVSSVELIQSPPPGGKGDEFATHFHARGVSPSGLRSVVRRDVGQRLVLSSC
jgi:2'-5' RNA ligase